MRIPFLQSRRRDYALEPLRIADSPAVSLLHREDFVRPWT
ncbi:ribosomal-protein-alanine acetyltransferase, partial [Mesorhizobium sp. M7A.F.Ca.AU.002.02.1.1]